jgi:hypothetical protein
MRSMKLALVVTLVAAAYGVQAQADPTVDTWKLNVASSKYNAGQPPKSSTVVIAAVGQGINKGPSGNSVGELTLMCHDRATACRVAGRGCPLPALTEPDLWASHPALRDVGVSGTQSA